MTDTKLSGHEMENVNVLDIYKFGRFLYNKNEQQVSELKTNSSV